MIKKNLAILLIAALVAVCIPVGVFAATALVQDAAATQAEAEPELLRLQEIAAHNDASQPRQYYAQQKAARGSAAYTINGQTVVAEVLKNQPGEGVKTYQTTNLNQQKSQLYNPSFAEAEMIFNTIRYKWAHPEQEVELRFSTFRLSVVASVCLDMSNPRYGTMTSLRTANMDDNYIRISYLLVMAAKCGVNVRVLGQEIGTKSELYVLNKAGNYAKQKLEDLQFDEFFLSNYNADCYQSCASGKKVSDFLDARKTGWLAYGDRSAADMMHYKMCSSSAMIGNDGNEHFNSIWVSSQNLDGIHWDGKNANNNMQTGVIVYDHEMLYIACNNYFEIQMDLDGKEDVYRFREVVKSTTEKQYAMYVAGKANEIPCDELLLYLGEYYGDPVFEMYFTPVGGASGAWDTRYNPYAKYSAKMLTSEGAVYFTYMNVKWSDCSFTRIWAQVIHDSFIRVNSPQSKLRILAVDGGPRVEDYADIVEGVNCSFKQVQVYSPLPWLHTKDITVSWVENGVRQYAVVQSSTNLHEGALGFQSNHLLVIKESDATGHAFYDAFTRVTYVWSHAK